MKPSRNTHVNTAKRTEEQEPLPDAPPRRLSRPLAVALRELHSDLRQEQIAVWDKIESIHAQSHRLTDEILVLEGCRQVVAGALMVGDTGTP